jgi:hypothetical protein
MQVLVHAFGREGHRVEQVEGERERDVQGKQKGEDVGEGGEGR